MKVWIVAEFLDDISKPATYNSRFLTVADLLTERGHEVQIITTDFVHSAKRHISGVERYKACSLTALHEPGYRKNVSLRRFYSHHVLGQNLKKWMPSQEKPDVIYCAVPSLDFAYEAARYAEDHGIRFVVDVQDLWPEAFEMVLHIPVLSRLAFAPLRMRANAIYRRADRVVAVSRTYADRALQVNSKTQHGSTVFLGTSLSRFDSFRGEQFPVEKQAGALWLGYVGTLGHSYDLPTVFKAMHLLKDRPCYERLKLVVMGNGPLRSKFEQQAQSLGLNVHFTGNLPYPVMVSGLTKCDIALNPIRRGAAQSIINKHGDYAAAGIPVLNTQEAPEYRELVEEYGMGINCPCQDPKALAEAIEALAGSEARRMTMGEGARRCARERFDRTFSYIAIVDAIEGREE